MNTRMLGYRITHTSLLGDSTVAQASRSQADVFNDLYLVFLILGTIVGVVVISYIVYNAYKYRTDEADAEGEYDIRPEAYDDDPEEEAVARPILGEIPTGTGKAGGKKLFLSFAISALIVVSLIIFAYWNFLYIEDTDQFEDSLEVEVEGFAFGWDYTYPSGETHGELVVPQDRVVELSVTSRDVWHTWGVTEFRAKTDAIPGQYTETWFQHSETGEYTAVCYELCGEGHSNMRGTVRVVSDEEFVEWCEENDCMDDPQGWIDAGGEA